MYILGTKNTGTQTVLTNGIINLGSNYRQFSQPDKCGILPFARTLQDITLQQSGIYHLTAVFVGSGTEAGDVTVQLLENGEVVDGALSTQTITTADTEIRTFVIDYYILVDKTKVLGRRVSVPKTISFENTGVGATFTSVAVNVSKEV